jgi:hypothetical protein
MEAWSGAASGPIATVDREISILKVEAVFTSEILATLPA